MITTSQVQWSRLECRLGWAYTGSPPARALNTKSPVAGYLSARHFRRGSGVFILDGEKHRCERGEWIVMPNREYRQILTQDAFIDSIRFRVCWPTSQPLFHLTTPVRFSGKLDARFTDLGVKLCSHVSNPAHGPGFVFESLPLTADQHFALQADFHAWLGALVDILRSSGVEERGIEHLDAQLIEATDYIRARIARGSLSTAEVARHCGLHADTLNRHFRSALGQTASRYIAERRLERVVDLVSHHRQPLKAAALECGFGSLQHFSRWFKNLTGTSPREYFNG